MYAANRTRHGRIVRQAAMVRTHPLNRQRVIWWLALPGLNGGYTWRDLAGNRTGTITGYSGQPWQAPKRPGGFGQLAFNGSSSYVTSASNVSDLISGGSPCTMAVWANLPAPGTVGSNGMSVFGIRKQSSTPGEFYVNLLGSNNFEARWSNTGSSTFDINVAWAAGWQHLAFSYDGSNTRFYVNGAQVGSKAVSGTFGNAGLPFTLGFTQFSGSFPAWFTGQQDDGGFWLRALSPNEVLQLYNLSRVGYPGLLARDDQALSAALYAAGSPPPSAPLFRRTLYARTGSRGAA